MTRTYTEVLNNLYTTTWYKAKSEVADSVFDAVSFWKWMKAKGKLMPEEGGRYLTEPIQYDKNDNVSWLKKGDAVSLNDFEFLTTTRWDWRYLVGSMVRFGVDDQQNRGRAKILNFAQAKIENTRDSLAEGLETALFAGSGAATNSIDGLQHLVQDDPTSATEVGGIDQSVYTVWQNQTSDMTGVSFAASGLDRMRTMVNNCQKSLNNDRPDVIVTGQTVYEYYEDVYLGYYQSYDRQLADLGIMHQQYGNIPMIWSPSCGLRMYFLNSRYIKMKYDPVMFFDMTEWKAIPDQVNDRAAQIVSALAFTTNKRRVLGVIHTIDTP